MPSPRRFPPPWSVDDPDMKLGQDCYIVRDANGLALSGSVQNLSHIWSGDGFGLRDLLLIERPHVHVALG